MGYLYTILVIRKRTLSNCAKKFLKKSKQTEIMPPKKRTSYTDSDDFPQFVKMDSHEDFLIECTNYTKNGGTDSLEELKNKRRKYQNLGHARKTRQKRATIRQNLEEDLVILEEMKGMVVEKQIFLETEIDSEEEWIEGAETAIRKRHLELTNSLPSAQPVDIGTVMKEIESVSAAHKQCQSSNMVRVVLEKREDVV